MRITFVLALLTVVFSSSLAVAQINPISRNSIISRTDGLSGSPASFSTSSMQSTSFAPFNGSLSLSSINQSSSFSSTNITVSTELSGVGTSAFGSDFAQTFGSLSAQSLFDLDFTVANPSIFSVSGTLFENDVIEDFLFVDNGGSFFDLTGPTSLQFQSSTFVPPTVISQNITLLPGTYNLQIGSTGSANQIEPAADSSAQFTLEFVSVAVPEPSSFAVSAFALSFLLVRRRRLGTC